MNLKQQMFIYINICPQFLWRKKKEKKKNKKMKLQQQIN